ncbi:MAG: hypothetical protein KDC84_07920 [Crocinitomicaceae bacterium]|nr:hypothetical protein [Crocinitomicaceae bacterium]
MHKTILLIILFPLFLVAQKESSNLCECINMNQNEMTKECEEVKQNWKQQFEAASADLKGQMVAEYRECKRLAEMETNPTICLCATIDPKLWNKNCKQLKKDWDKEYQKSDPEKQKDMKQEILDCGIENTRDVPAKDNELSQVPDDLFCDCMDYYGGKIELETKEDPDLKKIEQYDKINKAEKNKCLFVMRGLKIGTIETVNRAQECEQLNKYFKDTSHVFHDQLNAANGIDQILEKHEGRIEICSCIEIMKLEKSILEEKGFTINRRKNIQLTFEKPRQLCAKLIEGLSDEEVKMIEEQAKNCGE